MKPQTYHPKKDENGHPMLIHAPSVASSKESWADSAATAVFIPAGEAPAELNGVPLTPWVDHPRTVEGWNDLGELLLENLTEAPMQLPVGKRPAAGLVVEEADGRVWIVHPTNGFAGYKATFPKGHVDKKLSLQATAIKECFEESGLKARIVGLIGDVERGQTVTRYYRAMRVGGSPIAMGWETQAVSLVPKAEVADLVNRSYDKTVAAMAGF